MKLDLSEILSRVGMTYRYAINEPPIVDEDIECSEAIRGHIVFTNTGNVLLMRGEAETQVTLPCSRCLAYFEQNLAMPIEEAFTLETRNISARGRQTQVLLEDDENPDAAKLFEGPLFDLSELLRQAIMIVLPIQPLHDENCQGLCARCGKDLNEGPCACQPEAAPNAMSRLAVLLDKNESTER